MVAVRFVLEVHADMTDGVQLEDASAALCRLLRMSGSVLEDVKVRQAIALGRAAVEQAPPHTSISAYHRPQT